jgi:hypothetical protein
MPTIDFTLDDVRRIVREEITGAKNELRAEMQEMRVDLKGEMKQMRDSWDDNYVAEVERVSRIDKRLKQHSGDKTSHRA